MCSRYSGRVLQRASFIAESNASKISDLVAQANGCDIAGAIGWGSSGSVFFQSASHLYSLVEVLFSISVSTVVSR